MKIQRPLLVLATMLLACNGFANTAQTRYIHVDGLGTEMGQDQTFTAIQTTFADPLMALREHVVVYYSGIVDGNSRYYMNVIVEPRDDQGANSLANYYSGLVAAGFNHQAVHIADVQSISEEVKLVAGVHVPEATDGSFTSQSEISKNFSLNTLLAWEKFTDDLGAAFHSHTSSFFLNYIKQFLQNDYQDYATSVLSHSDVVLADAMPTILLEDGSTAADDASTSPFFDMPFVRECWALNFEAGQCN